MAEQIKRGVPTYDANDCPVCSEWNKSLKGKCVDCKKPMPEYVNMGKAGFEAVSIDHNHFAVIGDKSGLRPINKTLCRECYLKDYKAYYKGNPDADLTIEKLPSEVKYS